MNPDVISSNLRRLRSVSNLNQAEVARLAGINRITYRNIEAGESMPKVSTLQSIAQVLGVKLQQLVTPTPTLKAVRFRAKKKMSNRETILAEVAQWLEDYTEIEDMLNDHVLYRFESLSTTLKQLEPGRARAEQAASDARQLLGLDSREPINDIAGKLEGSGIKLYPLQSATEGFFGLSIRNSDDFGHAIVVNVIEKISVERWIFSAAHELGHLILHLGAYNLAQQEEDIDEENEADQFAAYFLMPQEAFSKEWDRLPGDLVTNVLRVKRCFNVSYKTVIHRLIESSGRKDIWPMFQRGYMRRYGRTLRQTDEPNAVSSDIFRAPLPEEHRRDEPFNMPPVDFQPTRLTKLIKIALNKNLITRSRAAEILHCDLEDLRSLTATWL